MSGAASDPPAPTAVNIHYHTSSYIIMSSCDAALNALQKGAAEMAVLPLVEGVVAGEGFDENFQ